MTAVVPKAPETTQGVQVELVIGGMTCAACAARVQAKLNKVTGVTASVNLSTERAYVSAPATVSAPDLIGVIQAAGYTAELARPAEPDAGEAADEAAVRQLRRRLTLALVFFVPLTDVSLMLSIFPWTRFPGWQWLLVALAAPVATWAAWPFHAAALRQARHLSSSMDTLVSLGILAACGWSAYAMFVLDRSGTSSRYSGLQNLLHGSGGGIYLEVAASVTTFLLAGRLYEARARRTSGQAMRELAAAGARDVCVLDDDGPGEGTERRVPAARLHAGQRFVVRPGERIAADGEVLAGQSAIDRSTMTGESVPVDAAPGDAVTGGTIVLTGRLVVRADKVGADTQLAHLVKLVEQAQAGKAGVQRLADRICAVFVPAVLACSVLTLAGWLLAGSPASHAFSAALAVLIIACPCALGLATPAALVVASGRGARMGIFIKGYQALESSRAIDTVVLDKTGTVTTGQMTVTAVELLPGVSRADLLRLRRLGGAGLRARRGRRRHRPGPVRVGPPGHRRRLRGSARPGRPRRGGRPRGRHRPVPAVRRRRRQTQWRSGPGRPGRLVPGPGGRRLHHRPGRLGRRNPRRVRRHRHGQGLGRRRGRPAARDGPAAGAADRRQRGHRARRRSGRRHRRGDQRGAPGGQGSGR